MAAHTSDLSTIGNIPGEYEHLTKFITPCDNLILPDAYLKWYEVHRVDAVISDEVRAQAQEFLHAETESGRLDISGELGFVILHLCGRSNFFLIVCTWRNQNEMWETLYAQDTNVGGGFELVPQGTHMEVICVWELGAVLHEQQAWTRYLRSARDEKAKRAYLNDQLTGSV